MAPSATPVSVRLTLEPLVKSTTVPPVALPTVITPFGVTACLTIPRVPLVRLVISPAFLVTLRLVAFN